MAIPQEDILGAEVVVKQNYADENLGLKQCYNVFHLRRKTFTTPPVKANLKVAFDTALIQDLLDLQADIITSTKISVRFISDPLDLAVEFAAAPEEDGQGDFDPFPPASAVAVLLRTGIRGKSYRGAKRFVGIDETACPGGYIGDTAYAAWQGWAAGIPGTITDSDGNEWATAILSRSLSDLVVTPATLVLNDIVSAHVNRNIGSQDSRRAPSAY